MLRKKQWLLGLSVVGLMLFSDQLASAQTEAEGTLVQDTFIRRAVPDEIYGFNTVFLSGNVADDWRTDALIQFELPEKPEGQQVQSASLDLFNNQLEWANRGNAEFGVMAVMFEWSEQDDAWDTIGDGDYGDTVYDVQEFLGVDPPHGDREDLFPAEWVTWDVTELVQAWYDESIQNNGLAIIGMATIDGSGAGLFPQFYSLDYLDDESLHPALAITFGQGGGAPSLQAGDADQDLKFDQLDLVKVQVAAKYLTGQPATWGEGDWNGAPGGQQGAPPPGNGLFDQSDVIAALAPGHYLTGPYAALVGPPGPDEGIGDRRASIVHNASAVDLIYVPEPSALLLVSLGLAGALLKRRRQRP